MKYHVNEHVCSALRCLETSLLKGVAKELDNLELPNVYFFNTACSMCIQNLRGMIANNSYNVNETDVKIHSLKELTDFNEPMVALSTSLRQAKVCKLNFYVNCQPSLISIVWF